MERPNTVGDPSRQLIDALVGVERRLLRLYGATSDRRAQVLSTLLRRMPPGPWAREQVPAAGEPSAGTYFLQQQMDVVSELLVSEHDSFKKVLLAFRPVLGEGLFADTWRDLRKSESMPPVRLGPSVAAPRRPATPPV